MTMRDVFQFIYFGIAFAIAISMFGIFTDNIKTAMNQTSNDTISATATSVHPATKTTTTTKTIDLNTNKTVSYNDFYAKAYSNISIKGGK